MSSRVGSHAADLGPLFGWSSQSSQASGTSGTKEIITDSEVCVPAVPEVPALRNVETKTFNDYRQVPSSGIHPLRGEGQTGTFHGPSGSSAALTLRSQRTDREGLTPEPALTAVSDQRDLSGGQLSARPYQVGAIEAVEAQFSKGIRRTLVVLPTGTGKTIVLALLLLRRKLQQTGRRARGLVLAHRTELIAQNAKKCREAGLTTSIEQGASHASRLSDVVVASVQTLQRARLLTLAHDEFDFIVIDEAHHVAAKGYQNIVEHFPAALVLGLTASPMRLDGKPLGDTFETTAFSYELRKAIADEWLVKIIARRVRITDVKFERVKKEGPDLSKEQLGAAMRGVKALQGVVEPTLTLAGSRRTLVFAVDVAHAHALADLFNEHKPGSAMALDGTMPDAKRRAVLDLFRVGAIQYLVNCELLTEGFDDPGIQCVVLARPTMSVALLIQMVGRGTRLLGLSYAESVANGKADLLLLDVVGNLRHRLATPADALAGVKLPEDLAAEIEKELERGKVLDVSLVLAGAEEVVRTRESPALVTYRAKDVDPFIGDQMPPLNPSSPEFRKPATEAQLAAIEKWGLSRPPVGASLSMGEASRILDGLSERKRLGLATVGQVRVLRPYLDCSAMTTTRASELFLKGFPRGADGKRKFRGPWIYRDEPEYRRSGGKS